MFIIIKKEVKWKSKKILKNNYYFRFDNAKAIAAEIGCPVSNIEEAFKTYNRAAKGGNIIKKYL